MSTAMPWRSAEADRAVRVIVVTGAGRGFCAGGDTDALEKISDTGAYDAGVDVAALATPGHGVRPEYEHVYAFHYGIPKPIIAAINGAAAGVGLVLACFCDMRFAAAGAKLTTSSGRLGLPAEHGLSWVLPRLVGIGHAADLLLSSRVVFAEEAAQIGLVNRVLPSRRPAAVHVGVRTDDGDRDQSGRERRGQTPALRRPRPRRRRLRDRGRAPPRRDGQTPRLRGRRPRVDRQTLPQLLTPPELRVAAAAVAATAHQHSVRGWNQWAVGSATRPTKRSSFVASSWMTNVNGRSIVTVTS